MVNGVNGAKTNGAKMDYVASLRSQLSNLCNYFAFVSQVELKSNNEAILISIGF